MTNDNKNNSVNVNNNEIPEMNIKNYSNNKPPLPSAGETKKEVEKKKKELENFKDFVVKKFPFVQAISLIPPKTVKEFIEDEIGEVGKELDEKKFDLLKNKEHIYIIIPEEKIKEAGKIKSEVIKYIDNHKHNFWIYVKTPLDIWEICFDSKFEMSDALGMSYPIYDKDNIIAALRVAVIHKSLVIQKFDRYVVSYVIAGSLVRGEAIQTSDLDAFVIINDTDVKRMPRLELKERLRGMIYQYVAEAAALAGVKNDFLSVQVYLLTEFWESVKDAHPVTFTFIRDGVPLYDKGTFMPWKILLKMGKLKPSPEAIDMFMSLGDNAIKRAKRALLDIAIQDIYWSIVTPSQALLMLNGIPPPAPKHLVAEMKKTFVEKERMLEKKYLDILEEIVGIYKGYEHEKVKEIKGVKIDRLIKNTEEYLKRLRELREQIEKSYQEKTIEQIYKDIFELLKTITGKKSQQAVIDRFKELVSEAKFSPQHLRILNKVIEARKEFKKGKSNLKKIDLARKNAEILINDLIEYSQRCELLAIEKNRMKLKYFKNNKEDFAEVLFAHGKCFLFYENSVKEVTDTLKDSNMNQVSEAIEKQKKLNSVKINPAVWNTIKKELGDFEIII